MKDFEASGDIVVDVSRLQARAAMRLSKIKPSNERQSEHLEAARAYLKEAGDLLREWDDHRLDEIADDAAVGALVERHVERILRGSQQGAARDA